MQRAIILATVYCSEEIMTPSEQRHVHRGYFWVRHLFTVCRTSTCLGKVMHHFELVDIILVTKIRMHETKPMTEILLVARCVVDLKKPLFKMLSLKKVFIFRYLVCVPFVRIGVKTLLDYRR